MEDRCPGTSFTSPLLPHGLVAKRSSYTCTKRSKCCANTRYFNRIEVNFLNSQGRLAEAEGEAEVWRDLRLKLFIDPVDMREQYDASPPWLEDP